MKRAGTIESLSGLGGAAQPRTLELSMTPLHFAVRGEYIQLDQLLKAAGLVGSGGEAHAVVEAGEVRVDGKPETRKRAKLRPGQRVRFGSAEVLLSAAPDGAADAAAS